MLVWFSPEYVVAGYAFETTRKAAWVAESLAERPIEGVGLAPPAPLTVEELTRLHDPEYVEAVRTGQPRWLAESQGFHWDPGLFTAVAASSGGAVAAARTALRDGVSGSLSSGLHHARRLRGNGYCTFNGLALAAAAAVDQGARVLILDVDAHCGGGTNELIEGLPGVWHTDISVSDYDHYHPGSSGTLDVVEDPRQYLNMFKTRLDEHSGRSFDLCLYNAGMDPYEGSNSGALVGLDFAVMERREQLAFQWCRARRLPIAFVLAGGYLGPRLSRDGLVNLHRLTLAAAAAQ
jgi:acetoin utilization deacetylase AcuC-like enzyme